MEHNCVTMGQLTQTTDSQKLTSHRVNAAGDFAPGPDGRRLLSKTSSALYMCSSPSVSDTSSPLCLRMAGT